MKTEVIEKMKAFMPYLNEEQTRLYVVSEVKALGRGGKELIENELCISHNTINKGLAELESHSIPVRKHVDASAKKEVGENAV
jgi:hypothetical protein